eukprot:TRINITY_DN96538_c0_g1_i1.p1 TRINITY_DN96538_c0_g1~~TRINITY_DN96538_c0_g1_i1.p1  ORF type:complete len:168 (+),score=25.65 TRINITY_DN96538_c0_g1_i1:109-612(+)
MSGSFVVPSSHAIERRKELRNGSDMLMQRLTTTNPPLSPAASAGAHLVLSQTSHLEPPFSRNVVVNGKVVDGGRYGHWAIGHGSHNGYWDRSSTPGNSRPASGFQVTAGHQDLHATNQQALDRFLPNRLPFETTFERVFARPERSAVTIDVSKRSPLINTSAGVVGR